MRLPNISAKNWLKGVLPDLLLTRASLEAIDQSLHSLSDNELGALVEQARRRNQERPDRAVATVVADAIQAARRARRS